MNTSCRTVAIALVVLFVFQFIVVPVGYAEVLESAEYTHEDRIDNELLMVAQSGDERRQEVEQLRQREKAIQQPHRMVNQGIFMQGLGWFIGIFGTIQALSLSCDKLEDKNGETIEDKDGNQCLNPAEEAKNEEGVIVFWSSLIVGLVIYFIGSDSVQEGKNLKVSYENNATEKQYYVQYQFSF